MTLNTSVICTNEIQFSGVHYVRSTWIRGMLTAWSMASLTAHVPFLDGFCFDVVVDGMAAIAQRPCRTFHVVCGIEWHPPVGVRLDEVCAPDFMIYIPLGPKREV